MVSVTVGKVEKRLKYQIIQRGIQWPEFRLTLIFLINLWIPSKECEIADLVTQFFIARTSSAGTVRMDPQFRRKAHREWFLDGLGYLRIAKERFETNSIGAKH